MPGFALSVTNVEVGWFLVRWVWVAMEVEGCFFAVGWGLFGECVSVGNDFAGIVLYFLILILG